MAEARLAAGLLGALLAGCAGDATVLGGGATETGNGVRVQVLDSLGRPVAGHPVTLVRTDTWLRSVAASGGPETRSVRTDAMGAAALEGLHGSWAAQAEQGTLRGWIPLRPGDTALHALRLSVPGTLRLRVAQAAGTVCAVGSAWCGRLDSAGTAALSLPTGTWGSVLHPDREADVHPLAVTGLEAGSVVDTAVRLDPGLLLDDFFSSTSSTRLARFAGLGGWYVASWGADSIEVDYAARLSLRYVASGTGGAALAGLAFRDAQGFRRVDVSGLDSLCLEVRGGGTGSLELIRYDSTGAWNRSVGASLGALDSLWRPVCLRPADFGPGWDSLKADVSVLALVASGGRLLEVRRPTLWGVPLQAFSR